MSRSIIITDLTRFSTGNPRVCIAGIDPSNGECIRPMPYLPFSECERLHMLPGGILNGNFTPFAERTIPHMEDCHHSELQYGGASTTAQFRQVLESAHFSTPGDGFDYDFPAGDRLLPSTHQIARSIITLQVNPADVEVVENIHAPGSIRLHFTDGSGRRWRYFPITDLGFFDYAQRHRASGALASLNANIQAQEAVLLRIGLTRAWKNPQGRQGYWMQANGIYTFPNVLRYIRCYPSQSQEP